MMAGTNPLWGSALIVTHNDVSSNPHPHQQPFLNCSSSKYLSITSTSFPYHTQPLPYALFCCLHNTLLYISDDVCSNAWLLSHPWPVHSWSPTSARDPSTELFTECPLSCLLVVLL